MLAAADDIQREPLFADVKARCEDLRETLAAMLCQRFGSSMAFTLRTHRT